MCTTERGDSYLEGPDKGEVWAVWDWNVLGSVAVTMGHGLIEAEAVNRDRKADLG